ncbi:MAG: DNA primase [Candidatus Binatia bacterium]|nr:MAG: DNA primase [Candidatus Binatia bacterium]
MNGFVAHGTLEEIQRRVSILDVVSAYVRLKKQGRNYVGLCPFHTEKTPSFSVSPEKGLFHCFGCGVGGNVFTFVMRLEGVDFRTAVERLAERAGVRLEPAGPGDRRQGRERVHELHRVAAEYFARCLQGPEGKLARAYLQHRGIDAQTVEEFALGYCPTGPGLYRVLTQSGVSVQEARRCGLLGARHDGGTYPRFGGRLIFPIRNATGKIVGFAGRAIGEQHPKYLNSPESEVFRKGELLFGLYEARHAMRESHRVLVVEGYFDVLSLARAGIREVVATMGTALTEQQLETLRRLVDEVYVCFDGDEAGRRAAERAFTVAAKVGIWAQALFLPAGEDPDSFVRRTGASELAKLMGTAVPLADFYLARKAPDPGASLAAKARVAREIGEVLGSVRDHVLQQLLVRKAAAQLGIEEHLLYAAASGRGRTLVEPNRSSAAPDWAQPEERTLLTAMAVSSQVAERLMAEKALDLFVTAGLQQLAQRIVSAWKDAPGPEAFLAELPEELQAQISAHLLGRGPLVGVDLMEVARDCLVKLRKRQVRKRRDTLKQELQAAEREGDRARIEALREELRALREELAT